jgi:hypothetical protein
MPKPLLTAAAVAMLTFPTVAEGHDLRQTGADEHVSKRVERVLGGDVTVRPSGLYRVETRSGLRLQTHGPDWRSEMLGADEDGDGVDDLSNGLERAPVCISNPATDYYQQVLYAYPTTTGNDLATHKADIQAQIRRNDYLLNDQSLASGGPEADFKVLCEAGSEISVTAFAVPLVSGTNATFSQVVTAAQSAGYTNPRVDYSVFFDGTGNACGVGNISADESPGPNNANNAGGDYGMTYRSCWFARTSMHENAHNEGAAQYSAPNSTGTGWHCNEADDILCYVDGGDKNQTTVPCSVEPGIQHYDCAWNTYFDSVPEPGEWLADHWNIGSSVNRFISFGTDTRVPDTTISSGPTGLTNDPTFSFASSEEPASFECSVHAPAAPSSYSPCSPPKTFTGLADGSYEVRIRSRDTAGNVDATPAIGAFTLDATGPDTRIDAAPGGTIASQAAQFGFSVVGGEPGASFQCALDGAALSACASPLTLASLGEGFHTFRVRAVDGVGNPDPQPASASFGVDTQPPETRIIAKPDDTVRGKRTAKVRFAFDSAEHESSFECSLDGGGFSDCSSPRIYRRLGRGRHRFEVRAIDTVGNDDDSPAEDSFKVKRKRR